ncbi:hypothetical protein ACNS7O_02715 [Haloferacaceae archaeon DSL9]
MNRRSLLAATAGVLSCGCLSTPDAPLPIHVAIHNNTRRSLDLALVFDYGPAEDWDIGLYLAPGTTKSLRATQDLAAVHLGINETTSSHDIEPTPCDSFDGTPILHVRIDGDDDAGVSYECPGAS